MRRSKADLSQDLGIMAKRVYQVWKGSNVSVANSVLTWIVLVLVLVLFLPPLCLLRLLLLLLLLLLGGLWDAAWHTADCLHFSTPSFSSLQTGR